MPLVKYWRTNLSNFRIQLLTVIFMTILLCFFLGMSQSTRLMFSRMSDQKIYSVYEGNLACPMSGLVPEKYVRIISKMSGVKAVSPEVRQNTVILPEFVVTILGVIPEKFRKLKNPDIKPEIWETFTQNPNAVLIGKDLAKTIINRYGQLENNYNIPFKVAGVFDYPLSLLNNMMIAHKDYLKEFLFKDENVTVINLLFSEAAVPEMMCQIIEDRLSDHKTKLVCRPETIIWERAQAGMAQFGKYVHWYGPFVIAILFCLLLSQAHGFLLKNSRSGSNEGIERPLFFHIRLFALNAIVGCLFGVIMAGVIFCTRPAFTGFDIFNPPVIVNFTVGCKVFVYIYCATFAANLCGIFLFDRLNKKALTWKSIAAIAILPLILIIFSANFLISYPFKLRIDLLNGAEPGNMSIYQAGTSVRIRQASNIPNTVLDVCQLASNIKTENGEKLYSPVVQLAASIERQNIPTIGINPATFFEIESKVQLVDGRKLENPYEIVIGRNVGLKLKRDLALGDILKIENQFWKIVGRFEANSYYDNFIITNISDMIEVTGRETLQAVLLKLDDPEKSDELSSTVQQYYGMLLDELPDLPHLAISSEYDQVAQLAASYNGLFPLNSGLLLLALAAGMILLQTLFGVPELKNNLVGGLSVLVISGLVIEMVSYFVGQHLHITLALTSFSLQPLSSVMGSSFIIVLVYVIYFYRKEKIWQSKQ